MIEDKDKIKQIEKDYKAGKTYNELAEKYNATYNEVLYLRRKNKWDRESNLSQVKKGNQNAKGNKGGPGAKKKNTNAVVTGAYQTIYDELLTDDEKEFLKKTEEVDKKSHLLSEINTLSIRERRLLHKIEELRNGKEMSIVKMSKYSANLSYKENGTSTTTEVESTSNIIQRFEDALTKVQEAKRRYLDSYHKVETDDRRLELELIRLEREAAKDGATENNENITDDSFIKALENSVEGTWDDYEEK